MKIGSPVGRSSLRASEARAAQGFIPERPQRELRELVRYRKSLVQERSREANRIQKVLEGANIKLGSVATDVLGAPQGPSRYGEGSASGEA